MGTKALRPSEKQCGEEGLLCLSVPRLKATLRADWEARARIGQGRCSSPAPWLPGSLARAPAPWGDCSPVGVSAVCKAPVGSPSAGSCSRKGKILQSPTQGRLWALGFQSRTSRRFSYCVKKDSRLLSVACSAMSRKITHRSNYSIALLFQSPETSEEEARSQGFASHPHATPHPRQRSSERPVPVCPLHVDPLLSGCIEHTGLSANGAQ